MKKMNKLTVAALALTVLGFASTAASAQVTPGAFDLVLGFQLSGVSSDLEVDLGPISALNLTPGAVTTLTSKFSVSDLSSTFGSSWADTTLGTGVNWGVDGINAVNDGASFYGSSTAKTIKTSSSSGLSNANGLVAQLTNGGSGAGSLNGATSAGTSTSSIIGNASNPASTLNQSYTSLQTGDGFTFVGQANEQTGAGTINLFSFTPQAKVGISYPNAINLGTFSLSDTGAFTFTAAGTAAVPEPMAYPLAICAGLLFLVLARRHSVV